MKDSVVAYPRSDRKYVLITDASTGTDKILGGFGAILTQMNDQGQYNVIAYGSRQLRDHELNYLPYFAEMVAANWGMEYFGNYLRGKPFTLYSDHKPLEKLSHLHTKTINRLQENMLTHDFQIQYRKGATLPTYFLSQDVVKGLNDIINSINPFWLDLQELQKIDEQLIKINAIQKDGKWPLNTSKAEIKLLLLITKSLFLGSKVVWIRLNDKNYPRTALSTEKE